MTLSKPTGTNDMTRNDQEGHIFLAIAKAMPEIRKRPTQPRNGSTNCKYTAHLMNDDKLTTP